MASGIDLRLKKNRILQILRGLRSRERATRNGEKVGEQGLLATRKEETLGVHEEGFILVHM